MRVVKTVMVGALVLLALGVAPVAAQSKTMTAQEQANLKLVSDWWREVIQARHVELAEKYMAEDYIQHNPNISTGRAAFVQIFGRQMPRDITPALNPAPVIQFAKGDYVAFIWEREAKEPGDPAKVYKYNFFDIVRVQDGKVKEHWDSVFKNPPPAGQAAAPLPVPGVGPTPVNPRNNADEAKNEAIALRMFKDVLQYGNLNLAPQLMAEGYIQHNPNVPTGRQGFVDFFSKFAKPEPIREAWKDKPSLVLTSGNMVLMMFDRWSAEPTDSTKAYVWNWFDMVRVDGGLVQEHWDMAMKTPPPATVPRPAGAR